MPQLDETHVQINDCTIVWDAITRPEENDGGNMRWGVKVVIHPQNPDLVLAHQLAAKCLNESEFKGQLPNGGIYPISEAGPSEFNGLFTGFAVINASTFKIPNVHGQTGAILQPMQYGNLLYAGQSINIVVNASAYNNKSKGIALRLDGFLINEARQAERLAFGGGGYDTNKAFGGGEAAAPQQPAAGGYQQQQQPAQQPAAGGYQQQPPQQPAAGGYQQQPAAGGYQQQPAAGGYQQEAGAPPNQATDFLPQQ